MQCNRMANVLIVHPIVDLCDYACTHTSSWSNPLLAVWLFDQNGITCHPIQGLESIGIDQRSAAYRLIGYTMKVPRYAPL